MLGAGHGSPYKIASVRTSFLMRVIGWNSDMDFLWFSFSKSWLLLLFVVLGWHDNSGRLIPKVGWIVSGGTLEIGLSQIISTSYQNKDYVVWGQIYKYALFFFFISYLECDIISYDSFNNTRVTEYLCDVHFYALALSYSVEF